MILTALPLDELKEENASSEGGTKWAFRACAGNAIVRNTVVRLWRTLRKQLIVLRGCGAKDSRVHYPISLPSLPVDPARAQGECRSIWLGQRAVWVLWAASVPYPRASNQGKSLKSTI